MKQLLTALLIASVSLSAHSDSYDWAELDRSWNNNNLGQFIRQCNKLYRMYPEGLPSPSHFAVFNGKSDADLRSHHYVVVNTAQFRYVQYMLQKHNPDMPNDVFIRKMFATEIPRAYEKMVTDCQRFM